MPSPFAALAEALEADLRRRSNPERAVHERQYLKSGLVHLGVDVPTIRRTATAFARAHPDLRPRDLLAIVRTLWSRGVHELRLVAVELLHARCDLLGPGDMTMIERLLRSARTWALVDPLAINVVGGIVERHPAVSRLLDRWVKDDDFWIRRAAVLAPLLPLRRGEGDFSRFTRRADALLADREFFIRKAIGWVLRETGKKRPALVQAYLEPRLARLSPLTLREATKPLPAPTREKLLAAARPRRDARFG